MRHSSSFFGVAIVAFSSASALSQVGMNCAKATMPAEKVICSTPELRILDRDIARAYAALKKDLSSIDDTSLSEREQPAFIRDRDNCESDRACLKAVMSNRRDALSLRPHAAVKDLREKLVGRYENDIGFAILRRRQDNGYELLMQVAEPSGRWACDVDADLVPMTGTSVIARMSDQNGKTYDLTIKLTPKGLNVLEGEPPLRGAFCGANGHVFGDYPRVSRFRS